MTGGWGGSVFMTLSNSVFSLGHFGVFSFRFPILACATVFPTYILNILCFWGSLFVLWGSVFMTYLFLKMFLGQRSHDDFICHLGHLFFINIISYGFSVLRACKFSGNTRHHVAQTIQQTHETEPKIEHLLHEFVTKHTCLPKIMK